MVFLYSEFAGDEIIKLNFNEFKHLKARRVKSGDRVDVRNLVDGYNYIYEILEISRNFASLELVFKSSLEKSCSNFSIAWAFVDPAVIEKTLPSLNEMGVSKLYLVYTEFSQKNFKLNEERVRRILISSSQQCGRGDILSVEIFKSLGEFLEFRPDISAIDFGGKSLDLASRDELFFIGPEGGFSSGEREKFSKTYSLNSKNILRSSTAIIAVAGRFLL